MPTDFNKQKLCFILAQNGEKHVKYKECCILLSFRRGEGPGKGGSAKYVRAKRPCGTGRRREDDRPDYGIYFTGDYLPLLLFVIFELPLIFSIISFL